MSSQLITYHIFFQKFVHQSLTMISRQRNNESPRLLEFFYRSTWDLPNVFDAFWLPRDTIMIKKCDILSKFELFENKCVISESTVKIRLDTSSDFEIFQRNYVDFSKIRVSLEMSLNEYTRFKKFLKLKSLLLVSVLERRLLISSNFIV